MSKLLPFEDVQKRFNEALSNKNDVMSRKYICDNAAVLRRQTARMDLKSAQERFRKIKEYSISNLEKLVTQAKTSLEKNGCRVCVCEKASEGIKIVSELSQGQEFVLKSKSNDIKEMGLTEVLEANGVKVIETDLGDRALQLCGEKPFHPQGPAVLVPAAKVAEAFTKNLGKPIKPVPPDIVEAARVGFRDLFFKAKVGITGANAIAAEGAVILVENEGNISNITRLCNRHIVVAGINKVVPTFEDAFHVARTNEHFLGILGTYMSVIAGPSRTRDIQGLEVLGVHGAREVHVVLVDDWRTRAKREGFEECLYCVHCSSCFYDCPTFRAVGSDYGYKYKNFGGIGTIHTAFQKGLKEAARAGLFACTLCRGCIDKCPGKIDTPGMIQKLRKRAIEEGVRPLIYDTTSRNIEGTGNVFGLPRDDRLEWTELGEQAL
nr:LUD domain-containing protein [Candidatus Njordarchaeota archaeon]